MTIVCDCSALLCLAFKDKHSPHADEVLEMIGHRGAIVPSIFWFEIRNVLLVNEHRRRITSTKSSAFLGLLSKLPIAVEALPPETGVLEIARNHQVSVYDASYIELAFREGLVLATLDEKMKAVAHAVGVSAWPVEA